MKSIFKDIFGVLKYNFRSIVIFEFIYRIVAIVLYMRIAKILVGYLMKCSGYSYLTLKNLGDILLNPLTYPIVLMLFLVAILFAGYEMAVLYTGFRAAAAGSNMKIRSMMFAGLKRFLKFFVPANMPVLLLNAATYFVLQIIPLRSVLLSSRRVMDALVQLQEIKLLKALAVFAVIGLAVCVIYNAFVLCYQAYGYKKGQLFKTGHAFWKGKTFSTVIVSVTELIVYLSIYALVYVICIAVVLFFVVLLARAQYEVVLADAVVRYVKLILAYFAGIAAVYTGIGTLVAVFYHHNSEQRQNIVVKKSYDVEPWVKKWFAVVGICVLLGTIGLISDTVVNGNLSGFSGMLVMSHRGDSNEAPENTIPAIELAIEKMSDYVEIDVHESKDGEIVVIHDASLKRTTGVDKAVKNMTYAELRELDAGSFFAREFAGTKIPTLMEVLDVCKSKINVNIEIKSDTGDSEAFIKKITELVKEYGMEEQCIFQASNYKYLKEIKANDTKFQTGLIIAAGIGNYFDDPNVDFFSINSAYINSGIVNMSQKHGKRLYAWTVNSYAELVRMKNLGVDGVITDDPIYAKEILAGSKETKSLISYIKMHMN